MPNHMIGLEYFAPYETVSTEEQLLEVFSDLKKCYSKLDSQFIMTDSNDVMITDFADFLEAATQEKSVVTLVGSGDIGGLKVENAVLTYDLSQVTEVTLYWDQHRDGSCHSCLDVIALYDDVNNWGCDKQNPMKWSNCPQYNAKLKNSEGKTARTLAELIAEAAK